MKLPPAKYPAEDCPRTLYFMKIENPCNALQQLKKKTLSFKSKINKIKATGICILQKSSRVYQNYFRS